MSLRQLVILAAGGLGAWVVWRLGSGSGLDGLEFTLTPPETVGTPGDYLAKLARVESSGNPLAKALTSSASGLYQFTKATWEALGGTWGVNPALPFGGLAVDAAEQTARAAALTTANAAQLAAAGIATTDPNIYAAHFLGPVAAIRVLTSGDSAPLSGLLSSATLAANPFLTGWTVAQFKRWLAQKMG